MTEGAPPRVIVAQKGSREHFLAARALHRRGMLAQLVVDWYVPARNPLIALGRRLPSRSLRRALGATCAELPDAQVRAMGLFGLQRRWLERRDARGGTGPFLRSDTRFAQRLAARRLPPHDAFFGYAYASLEMLEAEKASGRMTILDQIDPGQPEYTLVAEEARRWPEYAPPPGPLPEAYFARNRREWAVADVILVNSDWTRDLLVSDGAPAGKLRVVPLAFERGATSSSVPPRPAPPPPLRVLWLGTVCLRKGIPYLIDAARRLLGEPVEFDVAGAIDIRPAAVSAAPTNIRWHGPVPRAQAAAMFAASHVFVLPTISDGFGIVQLEALAHGLPVITTPNCARVIEPGRTGELVPPRDAQALAAAILRFVREPDRATAMAPACLATAARYTIDAYADNLAGLLRGAGEPRS